MFVVGVGVGVGGMGGGATEGYAYVHTQIDPNTHLNILLCTTLGPTLYILADVVAESAED